MGKISREMEFFIFLLEQYAHHKNMATEDVLRSWDEMKITDHIYAMYEQYHAEALENAYEDIDRLTKKDGSKTI